MTVANRARGEVVFRAGAKAYVLRPSFEALCAIEDRLGAGLIELAERITSRRYGVRELAGILLEGARAVDPSVGEAEIGAAIGEAGLRGATTAALGFLAGALGGPEADRHDPPPDR